MTIADLKRPGLFRLALATVVFVDHTTRIALGGAAVDLFFVLSGFWITKMWAARYSKTQTPYVTYLASRTWRLVPVVLLTSAMAWGAAAYGHVIPANLDIPHQLISTVTLLGYRSLAFQPNGPAWSLDIEMQFYILAPLLIAAIARHWQTLGCVAAISTAAGLLHDQYTLAPYLVFFSIGVCTATMDWKPSARVGYLSIGLCAAAILVCLASPYRSLLLVGSHAGPFFAFAPEAQIVVAALAIPWAIFTTHHPDTRIDGILGDLSFITYLVHRPVLNVIDTAHGTAIHRGLMWVAASGAVAGGSLLIWWLYDRPVQKFRKAWVASRVRSGHPIPSRVSPSTHELVAAADGQGAIRPDH